MAHINERFQDFLSLSPKNKETEKKTEPESSKERKEDKPLGVQQCANHQYRFFLFRYKKKGAEILLFLKS